MVNILKYISKLNGVDLPKTTEDVLVLASHLGQYYGQVGIEELRIAHDMNITGEYWKPIEIYKPLHASFISRVMSEYMNHRRGVMKKKPVQLEEHEATGEEMLSYLEKYYMENADLPSTYPFYKPYSLIKDKVDFIWDELYQKYLPTVKTTLTTPEIKKKRAENLVYRRVLKSYFDGVRKSK